jgi:DNA-binding MarR family transcriptional regulator
VSLEAIVWVLNQHIEPAGHKMVMIGIANHVDPDGKNAWPSMKTLARYASLSERRTQTIIQELAERGLIEREIQQGGDRRVPDDKRPNCYSILGMSPPAAGSVQTVL